LDGCGRKVERLLKLNDVTSLGVQARECGCRKLSGALATDATFFGAWNRHATAHAAR
jgi:hypothetical protein